MCNCSFSLALLICQATLEQHLAEKAVEMRILQELNDRLSAQASSLQQQLSSLQMARSIQDVGHMRGQQHPLLSTMLCACMSIIVPDSCAVVVELQTACCFVHGYTVTQTLLSHEQDVQAL